MNDDIVDRLLASVSAARATDRSDLLREAAAEIRSLRSGISRKDEAVMLSLKLTGDWAHRAGYHEGSLIGIMHGCPDPAGVAKRSLRRFGVRR